MRKMAFFALLYFAQGAALAYVINFQKPYLAGQGVSKEAIGLFTSLLLLPFILKVGLGALSDRVPVGRWGSRKPYMALGLGAFSLSYLSLSFVSPSEDFLTFAAVTWIASLGLALFDTCADGWALDTAEKSEQSSIQAAMISGKSLGLLLMSYVFGRMAESEGYSGVFVTIAAISAVVLMVVMLVPYVRRHSAKEAGPVGQWGDLLKGFYLAFAGFGVAYSVASFGTDGLVTLHFAETYAAGAGEIGVFGMARGLGALGGALAFAALVRGLGLGRSLVTSLLILGAGCLLPLAGLPAPVAAGLWGMAWGMQETAYVTLAMRFAQGAWSATFFAIAMIFSNIGTSLGEALAAPLVPQIGYVGVFAGFAVLAWSCLLFVPAIFKPLKEVV